MADIDVVGAEVKEGRLNSLSVRFKGNLARKIDRDTALDWLAQGHSLIPVSGHGHHVSRGRALERVEVDGQPWIRCDFLLEAADHVPLPAGH
ncbi:MAG TPA: hypothetical protein PKY30_19555 [Myxococcota bacterium]|nr:hypothetical protein [Myxococcota bacterium]HND32610.1 hypothetical protein [Myxococcota bacterium]HNH49252.1 hypothetical protein [Myxococcota bacterium]